MRIERLEPFERHAAVRRRLAAARGREEVVPRSVLRRRLRVVQHAVLTHEGHAVEDRIECVGVGRGVVVVPFVGAGEDPLVVPHVDELHVLHELDAALLSTRGHC